MYLLEKRPRTRTFIAPHHFIGIYLFEEQKNAERFSFKYFVYFYLFKRLLT